MHPINEISDTMNSVYILCKLDSSKTVLCYGKLCCHLKKRQKKERYFSVMLAQTKISSVGNADVSNFLRKSSFLIFYKNEITHFSPLAVILINSNLYK